jgi:hypothetical protein
MPFPIKSGSLTGNEQLKLFNEFGGNVHITVQQILDLATGFTDTLLELTDTPSDYTGAGGYMVRVATGETAVEFYDLSDTGTAELLGYDNSISGLTGTTVQDAIDQIVATDYLLTADNGLTVDGTGTNVKLGGSLTESITTVTVPNAQVLNLGGVSDGFSVIGGVSGIVAATVRAITNISIGTDNQAFIEVLPDGNNLSLRAGNDTNDTFGIVIDETTGVSLGYGNDLTTTTAFPLAQAGGADEIMLTTAADQMAFTALSLIKLVFI